MNEPNLSPGIMKENSSKIKKNICPDFTKVSTSKRHLTGC